MYYKYFHKTTSNAFIALNKAESTVYTENLNTERGTHKCSTECLFTYITHLQFFKSFTAPLRSHYCVIHAGAQGIWWKIHREM